MFEPHFYDDMMGFRPNYIGEMRTLGTAPIIKKVNQILTAYFHYYGIIDNSAINKKYADGFFFALQAKEKPGFSGLMNEITFQC